MKKTAIILLLSLLAWAGYQWNSGKERDLRILEVEKNLERGERELATTALNQLLAEQVDDPEALRLLARMEASESPRKALEILHRLRAANGATWQDLAFLVEISQDSVEVSMEKAVLAELQKDHSREPSIVALLARQDFLEGRIDLALRRLTEFSTKYPKDRSIRLERSRILLLSPDLTARIEAKQTLFELGKENDWMGLKALRVIVNREIGPTLFSEDLLQAALALQRHPLTGDASYLRASSIRLQLEPEKREEILADAIERLAKREKVLLAVWLNTVLAPTLVTKLLPLSEAVTDETKFQPLFQALLLLKRTSDARQLRKDAAAVLGERAKLQSAVYLELAEGKRVEAFPRFVRNAANSGDRQLLVDAGRLAMLAGRGEESWNAYLQALEAGGESIGQPVGLQLLQLALHHRETEVAWRIAKMLAERFSRRAGNRNNYAYLSLLLNREVEAAIKVSEEALKMAPSNTAFLSTLALGRLRADRWEEARELMERRGELGLTPGERATKASIFLALERKEDAVLAAQGLQPHMMLPEEWNLLGSIADEVTTKP